MLAPFQAPGASELERLAYCLQGIGKIPPFTQIQGVIKRVAAFTGITGAGPKAGSNLAGDLAQYMTAWYNKNPEKFKAIYGAEVMAGTIPSIPFLPNPKKVPNAGSNGFTHNPPGVQKMAANERSTNHG